ncbi:hypothetical protein ES703_17029 [subsurface metagenome]
MVVGLYLERHCYVSRKLHHPCIVGKQRKAPWTIEFPRGLHDGISKEVAELLTLHLKGGVKCLMHAVL